MGTHPQKCYHCLCGQAYEVPLRLESYERQFQSIQQQEKSPAHRHLRRGNPSGVYHTGIQNPHHFGHRQHQKQQVKEYLAYMHKM